MICPIIIEIDGEGCFAHSAEEAFLILQWAADFDCMVAMYIRSDSDSKWEFQSLSEDYYVWAACQQFAGVRMKV